MSNQSEIVGADRVAIALDADTTSENLQLVRKLAGQARWYKIGMRQFYRASEPILDAIKESGAKLFLDLKLHDIPQTVFGAAESLARYSPDLVTVHASGGPAMLRAAREGFDSGGVSARIVAVTVLTSLDQSDVRVWSETADIGTAAQRMTHLARESGADGIVCSANEVAALRAEWNDGFFVTPGIRPVGTDQDDQKRVATPAQAIQDGSSLLVVGRPIRRASDPVAAFERIASAPLSS